MSFDIYFIEKHTDDPTPPVPDAGIETNFDTSRGNYFDGGSIPPLGQSVYVAGIGNPNIGSMFLTAQSNFPDYSPGTIYNNTDTLTLLENQPFLWFNLQYWSDISLADFTAKTLLINVTFQGKPDIFDQKFNFALAGPGGINLNVWQQQSVALTNRFIGDIITSVRFTLCEAVGCNSPGFNQITTYIDSIKVQVAAPPFTP